jgi:hypothetical protein
MHDLIFLISLWLLPTLQMQSGAISNFKFWWQAAVEIFKQHLITLMWDNFVTVTVTLVFTCLGLFGRHCTNRTYPNLCCMTQGNQGK